MLSADRMWGTAAFDKFHFEITYLSDPSQIITLLPCLSVSSKLDWNANCKIVDVAAIVNVATEEESINDSFVEKLKFGQDIKAEFCVTFLKLKFGLDIEQRVWSRF